MKLTIIRDIGLLHIDGFGHDELDMSTVPSNVHALQWHDTTGEIEYTTNENATISTLPQWAQDLVTARSGIISAEKALAVQEETDRVAYEASPQYAIDQAEEVARHYLMHTDWYITRQAESGTAVPADVTAARTAARAAIA